MTHSYIPADRKNILKQFKYKGGTDSITYQYLWSPFAQYLLNYVPTWVAPNLITLIGVAMLGFVNIIFMLPDQNDIISNWKLIMMGLSILLYQHLDNLDGKQARKTKSSSPLGMLFDHGADAISAFFLAIQWMKILKIQYGFQLFCLYTMIMNTYFCAMWSQYSIGYFKLGRVNPVDQGLPAYALFCIISAITGFHKVINQQHILGTYGQQLIYIFFVLLLPQTIYMTKDIYKNAVIPKQQINFLLWLYISSGIAILVVYLAIPQLNTPVYYCFFYSIMFMWSRNMINIQLQYITRQKYRVFNRGTLSFLILCGLYILLRLLVNFDTYTYFLLVCIIQGIIFFQFVIRIFLEGSQILGIWVFSLKPRISTIQNKSQ